MENNNLSACALGNEKINAYNMDEWFKIFKSYANVIEKLFYDKKYDDCINLFGAINNIYEDIISQFEYERVLNKQDLTIAKSKFRDAKKVEKFSNKKYKDLKLIRQVYTFLAAIYKEWANEAYTARDFIKALKFAKSAYLYNPDDIFVNFTLAKILDALNAKKEAADSYEKVLSLDKNYEEGKKILAGLYCTKDLSDFDKSIYYYEEYLKKAESDKFSWLSLASQYYNLGLHKKCAKACEKVFKIDSAYYLQIATYMLNYLKMAPYSQKKIKETTERLVENYINTLGIKKCAFNFNDRNKNPNKRIRIGYLSSDLYHHVVSRFLMPIIENHNKENFEIYMYMTSKNFDDVTETYQKLSEKLIQCNQMPIDELAQKIYEDEIDILVDLNIHTGDTRVMTLAKKPAPVQCVYLGYPNTSGLDTIDYILTDKDTIKPGEEGLYTEKPAWIEAGYEVIEKSANGLSDITEAPYIRNKYVTMGVFNAVAKITNEMLEVWAKILKKAKNTKILFQYINYYTKNNQKRILKEFVKHDIEENRIIFMEKAKGSHYNAIACADFALDVYPYSGTGTTMDCIMMGLPVVCLEGYNATSRPTSRILKAIGEIKLITPDFDGYIQNALDLINNPDLISEYRKSLREKLFNSKLTDYKGFTLSLENTYRKIWMDYCNK